MSVLKLWILRNKRAHIKERAAYSIKRRTSDHSSVLLYIVADDLSGVTEDDH